MPITKETREFFLRNTQVNAGAKRDQETGFALQYLVDGVLKYNRFLKGNFPSESVLKKLFESIAFKLNPEDTATALLQGLVKIATDVEAISGGPLTWADGMVRVTMPHQLPTTIANATPGNVIVTVAPVSKSLGGGRSQIQYQISANYTAPDAKVRVLYTDGQTANLTNIGSGLDETLATINIPAGTLAANGDYIEVDGSIITSNLHATPTARVIISLEDGAGNSIGGSIFAIDPTFYESKVTYRGCRIRRIDATTALYETYIDVGYSYSIFASNGLTSISAIRSLPFNSAISNDLLLKAYSVGAVAVPIGTIVKYPFMGKIYTK